MAGYKLSIQKNQLYIYTLTKNHLNMNFENFIYNEAKIRYLK